MWPLMSLEMLNKMWWFCGLSSLVVKDYRLLWRKNFLLVGLMRLNMCSMNVGMMSWGRDFGFNEILSVGRPMQLFYYLIILIC